MKAKCIWFTGLPCSGKTTLANSIAPLFSNCQILDGDVIRSTALGRQAGFSEKERYEHLERMGQLASMFTERGVTTICSFVSPLRKARVEIRELFAPGQFVEVYLKTPLDTCIKRDVKGMYAKARQGLIKNFTGLGGAYEAPLNPEISLDTSSLSIEDCKRRIMDYLRSEDKPASMFIGRWNGVFHLGHNHIIMSELDKGNHVLLAVRDVAPDEKNPWPASQVKSMLEHRFRNYPQVSVIIIPDIASVNYGRGVGYEVKEIKVTADIAGISGTKIRKMIGEGDQSWVDFVPSDVASYLQAFYSDAEGKEKK